MVHDITPYFIIIGDFVSISKKFMFITVTSSVSALPITHFVFLFDNLCFGQVYK